MTQLPLAVAFALLGLSFCFPQFEGRLGGNFETAKEDDSYFPPLNVGLGQLIVQKIKREVPKPTEEAVQDIFKSFVSFLYERHQYAEAKRLHERAESVDAQAAFKAALVQLQQASQQDEEETSPLAQQNVQSQDDPEVEQDPALKVIKLKSLFKFLLNYKSYFKVGQEIVNLGLPKEITARLFFESFVDFLCDSKDIVETAKKAVAMQQLLQNDRVDAEQERQGSEFSQFVEFLKEKRRLSGH